MGYNVQHKSLLLKSNFKVGVLAISSLAFQKLDSPNPLCVRYRIEDYQILFDYDCDTSWCDRVQITQHCFCCPRVVVSRHQRGFMSAAIWSSDTPVHVMMWRRGCFWERLVSIPQKYPKAAETNSSQPAYVTFAFETIVILNAIWQADETTSIVQFVPIGVETALWIADDINIKNCKL